MKGVVRRLAGLLGLLFIAVPVLMICSLVSLPVWIFSPSKGDAIFIFGLDCCKPFADLME